MPGGNCAPKSLISRPVFGSSKAYTRHGIAHFARRLAALTAAAFFAPLAQAQAPVGDAKRGHDLAYTCQGCHAIPNYKNVYPTYSVPKLHGQRPEYLVAALKAYKSGERSHGTMHSQAASMSEQDMADIAVYLAGPEVLTKSKNDVPADKRPKASETCLACHGTNGVGITADYPTIAGQHKRLHRARAARLPEGRPQERHHGGHGGHAHAARTSSSWRSTTRARRRRSRRCRRRVLLLLRLSPELTPLEASYFAAASCFSRNVTIVFW